MEKRVMIIGAGKIGRGYLADLFGDAGYHIIFVDAFTEMVDKLNEAGKASAGIRDLETLLVMVEAGATRIGTTSGVKIINKMREKNNI